MHVTTMSSREFNQDVSKAKKAALSGPVHITDRGKVAHVLLSVDGYQSITDSQESIVELLAMPGSDNVDFEPHILDSKIFIPAELD